MNLRSCLVLSWVGYWACPTVFGAEPAQVVHVRADFSKPADYPLVKDKFGVFNSGIVPVARYERDIKLYGEVRPEALRIDLGWGGHWAGWKKEPVSGTAREPRYDFSEMDRIAALLRSQGVQAYWSYCYVPDPFQPSPGAWRGPVRDVGQWAQALGIFAQHYRGIGYQEVYNEPDNRDFFRGTLNDYLAMYRQSAEAIRAADADAMVGGPALAFTEGWIDPFLQQVPDAHLPLDFFSFHYYPGVPYPQKDLAGVVEMVEQRLDRYPKLRTTELHLNEYNSYKIDYPRGGPQDRYPLASAFLRDVAWFLSQPALTRVYWAQFQDSGQGNYSGMISIDGHRKAVYNAYRIYSMMPVDRCELHVDGPAGVAGMASANDHVAGIVLWNRSDADQELHVSLDRLPFERGGVHRYRIDRGHASWGDGAPEELTAEDAGDVRHGTCTWSGSISKDGVVYLEAADAADSPAPLVPAARVVRELHDYPNRTARAYADFDRRTWVTRLGMAGDERGDAVAGVVAEQLPPRIEVTVEAAGALHQFDDESALAVRIDFHTHDGYARSTIFHGPLNGVDLFHSARPAVPPWGTKRPPDRVVRVNDLHQFVIEPAREAPPGWTGRCAITWILRHAGPEARVRIRHRAIVPRSGG